MISSHFPNDFFIENRKRLRAACPDEQLIVVAAHGLVQKSSDESYPFHQERNFWYLTGINLPDAVLVIDLDKEYLIVPELSKSYQIFNGAINVLQLSLTSGIDEVFEPKKGWKILSARLKKARSVAVVAAPPAYLDSYGMYTNPSRANLIDKIKSVNEKIKMVDIRPEMSRLRMVKQPLEIDAIAKAIDITGNALSNVFQPIKEGNYTHEYQVEAEITRCFRAGGASGNGHSFTPIVAGGIRGCTLHNISNDAPIVAGETLVMDIGADYLGYAADITRTIVSSKKPSARQKLVYDAVLAAQTYAISLLKPGVVLGEYEQLVAEFVGEKLIGLGLISKASSKNIRQYFPHSTSHFLGLDTHDAGDYSMPLQQGVVITVEPGIYIPEESIGIRIEDDVVITSDGCRVLSQSIPKGML